MDPVISAVASDLFSRFISYLLSKSQFQATRQQKVERLQRLLLRAHTVLEEADGRSITNAGMLAQLKMLSAAVYRGYHTLDAVKYRRLDDEGAAQEQACQNQTIPWKRLRFIDSMAGRDEMQSAVDNLESVVTDMAEFVVLLARCERICRRPHDTYLYTDHCIFGRHGEKHQLINALLQQNPLGATAVIPVIGPSIVGKKTLVAHACNDERVRSHFSSILHLNGENMLDCQSCMPGKTLVVVEFVSDVGDEDWEKFFCSSATSHGEGNKMIIISRLEKLARFGTVPPIRLNRLTDEEFSYLFKHLAFGSANPDDHPQLASVAKELPAHLSGSLISANAIGNMLRKKMDTKFWTDILGRCRSVVRDNCSIFGEHPRVRLDEDRPIEVRKFLPSSFPAALRLMRARSEDDVCKRRQLPEVMFEDLLLDPTVMPKGEFDLLTWNSRMPPYTKTFHLVPSCRQEKKPLTLSLGKKRRGPI